MNPEPMVNALATALFHFSWQATAVALLLWLVSTALSSARARYAAGCAALVAMVACFAVTLWLALPASPRALVATRMSLPGALPAALPQIIPTAMPLAVRSTHIPTEVWIVGAWALGALLMSARIAAGWLRLRWLVRRAAPAEDLQALVDRLAARVGVRRGVRVVGADDGLPMVIGWLRPVIMLPASAVTGLGAAQLEAVIIHELAHVRRLDFLVNLAQSLLEALFFFHPAVWWVSARVRGWREHCCDDEAVNETGDALGYARALAALEEARQPAMAGAVGLGGGSLLERVRRLVRPERRSPRTLVAALFTVGAAAIAVAAASACIGSSDKLETMALDVAAAPRFDPADGEPTMDIAWLPPSVSRFAPLFLDAARRHRVDPEMLAIVTLVESGGWVSAESPSGARGLMQIMPATGEGIAKDRGVSDYETDDLGDPAFNIDFGAWYLARQLEEFSTDDGAETVERIAAAYNGGPGRLRRHLGGEVALTDETTRYKTWVKQMWLERKQAESETFRMWMAAGGERLVGHAVSEMEAERRGK